jgi:hypothetical protein
VGDIVRWIDARLKGPNQSERTLYFVRSRISEDLITNNRVVDLDIHQLEFMMINS